jgi:1-acyl-sn-glycerol-3-phosphate acyltransferase
MSSDSADLDRRLAALTEVNLDDLCDALGLKPDAQSDSPDRIRGGSAWVRSVLRRAVRAAGRPSAQRFAAMMIDADARVGRVGLSAGATHALGALHTSLRIVGAERLPAKGPVLYLSNHPGMSDTLALFAAIPHAGLRTIAARRPFLQLLPHFAAPLIWVDEGEQPEEKSSRLAALRAAAAHLRAGGALLTFPAGRIEGDPARRPDAADSLRDWNPSTDLLGRLAPDVTVVPVLVSGVISAGAAGSPVRRLRSTRAGQDLLGAMLQLSWPPYAHTEACVRFGPPLPAAALFRTGRAAPPLTLAVTTIMRSLIDAEVRDRQARRTDGWPA